MNFAELLTEANEILKRPDQISRLESAIRAATLKIHTSNFWQRDVQEKAIKFEQPDVVTNFDPRATFPRFRKLAYIRVWNFDPSDNETYGAPGIMLTSTEMGDVLDYWGYHKTDIFYEAGDLIQIRSSMPLQYTLVGAYNFPMVTPNNEYSSWVATDYPWAIIHEAVSQVCKQIGYEEMAQMQQQEAAMQLSILNMQNTREPVARV